MKRQGKSWYVAHVAAHLAKKMLKDGELETQQQGQGVKGGVPGLIGSQMLQGKASFREMLSNGLSIHSKKGCQSGSVCRLEPKYFKELALIV
jgi:hypothetical protein